MALPIFPLVVIALGLLPSVIWVIFFLQEDYKHPEPVRLIVYAFGLGTFATLIAFLAQFGINNYFTQIGVSRFNLAGVSLFAAIEEVVKFLIVFWFISKLRDFDEPLDAMIYMIVVALGFAAVENIASLWQRSGVLDSLLTARNLETIILRFLGANLLHSLTSGLVGFYWAIGMLKKRAIGLHIAAGLAAAIVLHSFFNYLILKSGPASWAIVLVVFIAFFVITDFEKLKAVDP